MKKVIVVALLFVILMSFFGCENVSTVKPEDITDIDYMNLYNKHGEYEGKWVRISGKIDSKGKNAAVEKYIVFREGFGTGLFNVTDEIYITIDTGTDKNFDNFNEGDYITVVGCVGTKTLGTLNIDDSYIEYGGEASVEHYAYCQNLIEEGKKKEKEDFVASCQEYDYKELARNPHLYKGKNIKFTGEVIQVQESTITETVVFRINVTKTERGNYTDTIYCEYIYSENESKILEGDIVEVYAISQGDKTYQAVLGNSVTLPYMEIKYIDLLK